MTVDIGIVGCGHMGSTHGHILSEDTRVRIIGVTDLRQDAAHKLAADLGCRVFADLAALLHRQPNAVYVTTPNALHREPVIEALRAGCHVFCEKPMATCLREADEIRNAVHRSGLLYQIGFNRRFAPSYRFARAKILTGFRPVSANVKMNRGELQVPSWVGDTSLTGGFLYESTIHLMDMVLWLMGEVEEVVCRAEANVYDELDDFSMVLTFSSGHHAVLSSSAHTTWAPPFERLELYGVHAQVASEEMERAEFTPGLGEPIQQESYSQLDVADKWGYREEDRQFVGAVLGTNSVPVTVDAGYAAVELVEAAYRSARTGRPTDLPLTV
jgi:myo-inositol 2-dehydrogenase/D-chiro-inositol 1-dehydrogenase